MRMRLRDVNLEAASRRSYFGLSLLAFAARLKPDLDLVVCVSVLSSFSN
jgi:hypothetical protein